jgi:hypothetical protein
VIAGVAVATGEVLVTGDLAVDFTNAPIKSNV